MIHENHTVTVLALQALTRGIKGCKRIEEATLIADFTG